MSTLTITAKGQITLKKDLLNYLGVAPGQKVEVQKLPNGTLNFSVSRKKTHIKDVAGCLKGKTDKVATIEEINEAIAKGWAGLL